ncbi:MAG: hypothetical protein ACPG80_04285 [Rickettsiales bacterium]
MPEEASNLQLVKRLALAVVGQALPETSALATLMDDARKALLATVVTGVLLSALLLLAAFGLYLFLVEEGLAASTAVFLGAGMVLLLAIISGLIADRYTARTQRAKRKLGLFPPSDASKPSETRVELEPVIEAFLNGLLHPKEPTEEPEEKPIHRLIHEHSEIRH